MLPSARGASLPQHILISEKERLSQMLYTNPDVYKRQDCIRDSGHVLDTAQVLLQLFPFLLQLDNFFLRQNIEGTV